MDKIVVRTQALGQALTSLYMAGCQDVEISLVPNAIKVEGVKEGGEVLTLHVWSKDAEATAEAVGKGKKLTEEDCKALDLGICPICEEREQLRKGPKAGLAIMVSCDKGHLFWVPPPPFEPEYRGMPAIEAAEGAEAQIEQDKAVGEIEEQAEAEGKEEAGSSAEDAIEALEKEEKPDEASDTE